MDGTDWKIPDDEFEKMPIKRQLVIIYSTMKEDKIKIGKRLKSLEKRKRINMAMSGSFGIFGGFIATLVKTIFKF